MEKIYGFSIRAKGRNLYAVRREGKKIIWVSLGQNVAGADTKIKTYCLEKGLALERQKGPKFDNLTEKVRQLETAVQQLMEKVRLLEERQTNLTAIVELADVATASHTPNANGAKVRVTVEQRIEQAKSLMAEGKTWNEVRRLLNLDRNKETLAAVKHGLILGETVKGQN